MNEAVVRRLAELNADGTLILAALDGAISDVACAMPDCACVDGRAYFTRRGNPRRGAWAPSADRWPVPGRDGGEYVTSNVRLAHWFCNNSDGGKVGGKIGGKISGPNVTPARRAYYESEAARENGRRLAADPAARTWQQSAEGREVMARTARDLAEWHHAHPEINEANRANGQRLAEWHRVHPEVGIATGKRLAANPAGAEARKRWRESPEGQATLSANGRRTGLRKREPGHGQRTARTDP